MTARRPRGFTLIEMMVALTMALVVTASALGVLLSVMETQREGEVRAQLARDAQLMMDMLARDFATLGVGVPRGLEMDQAGTTALNAGAPGRQLRPPIRIGDENYIAFLGDLPLPSSDLNGLAFPTVFHHYDVANREERHIAVVSELTPCTPPSTAPGYGCASSTATLLEVPAGANCDSSNTTAPTCPWGLGKWGLLGTDPDPVLVVGDAFGGWYQRTRSGFASHENRTMLELDDELPVQQFRARGIGSGFMAQLDRVFYSVEETSSVGSACTSASTDCTLRRRQCWGDINNASAALFPGVGASAIRAGSNPSDCTAGSGGTPWEDIMDGIDSFQIQYFDANGGTLTAPLDASKSSRVRYVDVSFVLKRSVPSSTKELKQAASRRFYLEFGGGLITDPATPLAGGGCDSSVLPDGCAPL